MSEQKKMDADRAAFDEAWPMISDGSTGEGWKEMARIAFRYGAEWQARASLPVGVPDFEGIVEAGEKLYNELRQWLATENDANSQEALQAWRDAYHTPAAQTVNAERVSVPVELMELLRNFTLQHDSGVAGVLRGNIDALLASHGRGEA